MTNILENVLFSPNWKGDNKILTQKEIVWIMTLLMMTNIPDNDTNILDNDILNDTNNPDNDRHKYSG